LHIADATDERACQGCLMELPVQDRRSHLCHILGQHVQLPRTRFDFGLEVFEMRLDRLGFGRNEGR